MSLSFLIRASIRSILNRSTTRSRLRSQSGTLIRRRLMTFAGSLGPKTKLISSEGNVLLTIVADTCGRHDTLGGACAAESNQVRYAIDKKHLHNCRNTFLLTVTNWGNGFTKRDLTHNINFFMNVPVTPEGALTFEDGVSDKGRYVEMKAETDVICLLSNCQQLNNPCNAYNPTPVRLLIW